MNFLHSDGFLFRRSGYDGVIVLRENLKSKQRVRQIVITEGKKLISERAATCLDLIIRIHDSLNTVDVGKRIFDTMRQHVGNELHSDFLLENVNTISSAKILPRISSCPGDVMGHSIFSEIKCRWETEIPTNADGNDTVGRPLPLGERVHIDSPFSSSTGQSNFG